MKTIIDKFVGMFRGISFNTYETKTREEDVSQDSLDVTYKQLKKMLMRAKRDLSKAKKSHKLGIISSDELFDWQYRVHEIEEDIKILLQS